MDNAEALAEPGHARRVHVEPVAGAQLGKLGEVRLAVRVDLGQLAEEVLEAGRRDDLDDLAGRVTVVPECVPLIAGLEYPRSGPAVTTSSPSSAPSVPSRT